MEQTTDSAESKKAPRNLFVIIVIAAIAGVIGKELVNTTTTHINKYLNKKAFITGCLNNGGNQAYCQCTYDKLMEIYTFDEYKTMGKVISEHGINSEEASIYKKVLLTDVPQKCK